MTEDNKALVISETGFVMAPTIVKQRMAEIEQYRAIMREGEDYGTIPGTPKPTLYQPGADTLCIAAGLGVGEPVIERATEDWEFGFFFYLIKQPLIDQTGNIVAWGIGSCSSKEDKYAWRWVPIFKLSDEDKKAAEGEQWHREWRVSKGGKRFLMYRMPNPDPYSQANTILKMATKRAYVSATLRATGAHRVFTQDVEDLPMAIDVVEGEVREVPAEESSPIQRHAPTSAAPTIPAGATGCPHHPDRVPSKAWSGYTGSGSARFKIEGRKCTAKDGDSWCAMLLGNDGYWYENTDKSNYRRIEPEAPRPPEADYIPPEEEGMDE